MCLSRIGIVGDKQTSVFAIAAAAAAAVLHIDNITIEEKFGDSGDHTAAIIEASRFSLQKACEFLGLKEAEASEPILTKLLSVRGKTIKKQSTVAMVADERYGQDYKEKIYCGNGSRRTICTHKNDIVGSG